MKQVTMPKEAMATPEISTGLERRISPKGVFPKVIVCRAKTISSSPNNPFS
jgi:hypothetical protein